MGARQSDLSDAPSAREPAVLLTTSAGVIVRIPDAAGGASCFHHNPRSFLQPATVADALQSDNRGACDRAGAQDVTVAKAGAKNGAFKNKVVYVKKPPRPYTKAEPTGTSSVQ
ncbi:hypothetical protein PybrP1_003715 [[Pythium] brassicae (nom. inval.)]|nr:hypothetical protein PybrP1_003715 [[Pythium] brassicae (nom. inval.)]